MVDLQLNRRRPILLAHFGGVVVGGDTLAPYIALVSIVTLPPQTGFGLVLEHLASDSTAAVNAVNALAGVIGSVLALAPVRSVMATGEVRSAGSIDSRSGPSSPPR